MTKKGYYEVPECRLKFRTTADGEWLTATIWWEDKPMKEVSRLHTSFVASPSDPAYQSWVAGVSTGFQTFLKETTKLDGWTTMRRKASYKGEE